MKIGVLLSGNGVYDGSEIQESIFSLLAIAENGAEYICFAPNIDQHHVINHTSGEEMNQTRNVLVESARIARGEIKDLAEINESNFDALLIPGGFGTAKNLTKWAFSGPDGEINDDVKRIILETKNANKPIAALCMGPTVLAKAFEGQAIKASLSVGSSNESSPYEIGAISQGMEKCGAVATNTSVKEIEVDTQNKIICAPCYMMDASILEVRNNVKQAVDKLIQLI